MRMLAAFPLLIGSATAMAAIQQDRAITMDVEEAADTITVTLRGHSAIDQQVSYELSLEGRSTSRHKGRTHLSAGQDAVLSTMRMSAAEPWCIRAAITEADGTAYEYAEGTCD